MQIMIDIPEVSYESLREADMILSLQRSGKTFISVIYSAVANGTPLPKEHGRLSDMDELVKNIVKEYGVNSIHELPQDIKMFYDKFINSAPTILDATFDYKLKNYAFFRKEKEK